MATESRSLASRHLLDDAPRRARVLDYRMPAPGRQCGQFRAVGAVRQGRQPQPHIVASASGVGEMQEQRLRCGTVQFDTNEGWLDANRGRDAELARGGLAGEAA